MCMSMYVCVYVCVRKICDSRQDTLELFSVAISLCVGVHVWDMFCSCTWHAAFFPGVTYVFACVCVCECVIGLGE